MFAALSFDKPPLELEDIPAGALAWVQVAGGVAIVVLLLFGLVRYAFNRWGPKGPGGAARPGLLSHSRAFNLLFLAVILCYLAVLALRGPELLNAYRTWRRGSLEPVAALGANPVERTLLTAAGAGALLLALFPMGRDLLRLRTRRIWAIAVLSMKDAIRRRVLWAFSALLLVILFASWFIPYEEFKPEDQVRNYVGVVYWAMSPLLILVASLLAAFSIPTDVRQQTIHTVVTKPVERFEIVLGRFIGFSLLMTGVLLVVTTVGLLYVARGVNPDAAYESFKARVPQYANELEFQGTERKERGENVGKEWDYRSYIPGPMPEQKPQYAIWNFLSLPADLAGRESVRCEFNFDIYRTTRGLENKGVFCNFYFQGWRCATNAEGLPLQEDAYKKELDDLERQEAAKRGTGQQALSAAEVRNRIAEKHGFHKEASKEVLNNHTLSVEVPAGVFRSHNISRDEARKQAEEVRGQIAPLRTEADPLRARAGNQGGLLGGLSQADQQKLADLERRLAPLEEELARLDGYVKSGKLPPLRVRVRCISSTQFLGMAKYDLYFRLDQPDSPWESAHFYWNFYKAAAGLWMRLCLVIGVAVALSTYLSGMIAWLVSMLLFTSGFFREFILSVAEGSNPGGGPVESGLRLVRNATIATDLGQSPVVQLAVGTDEVYRVLVRAFLSIIPDVERFDFADKLREGFDISGGSLFVNLLLLIGYLVPWSVVGYYLIKSREVATW